MEEPRERDAHPFEQFKATMRKLVTVSKADLDAAPKAIEAMKQAVAAAADDAPKKKAAADEFAKSVNTAKAHVDDLAAQYQRLSQEASAAPAPAAMPKG